MDRAVKIEVLTLILGSKKLKVFFFVETVRNNKVKKTDMFNYRIVTYMAVRLKVDASTF